ncbi:MAG: ABC transporter permease [Alphaproteobacteria bacterium]|nr:ABC transporter permease [Alphaproteobacteria bacterium]
MSLLWMLAWRSLTRNLKRTAITSAAIIAGVAFLIPGVGMIDGLDENILRAQIDSQSGHVLLRPPGAPVSALTAPLDVLEPVPEPLAQALAPYTWTPRLLFDGFLVGPMDSIRARGIGFDPARDGQVFARDGYALQGAWPQDEGVVLGVRLATLLELGVGDTVMVRLRTAQGAINALALPVVGVVRTRTPAIDNFGFFVPMAQAQALTLAAGPSQIALRLEDRRDAAEVAAAMPGPWTANTYRDEAADMLDMNHARRQVVRFVVVMLMVIAGLGIANTAAMSAYERVREVGTLAAMGMSRRDIRALFLLEGALLGLAAATVGALLGAALNGYLATVGVDVSAFTTAAASALTFDTQVYTTFAWGPVLAALVFGAVMATAASLVAARYAANLNPADAVRAD